MLRLPLVAISWCDRGAFIIIQLNFIHIPSIGWLIKNKQIHSFMDVAAIGWECCFCLLASILCECVCVFLKKIPSLPACCRLNHHHHQQQASKQASWQAEPTAKNQ